MVWPSSTVWFVGWAVIATEHVKLRSVETLGTPAVVTVSRYPPGFKVAGRLDSVRVAGSLANEVRGSGATQTVFSSSSERKDTSG